MGHTTQDNLDNLKVDLCTDFSCAYVAPHHIRMSTHKYLAVHGFEEEDLVCRYNTFEGLQTVWPEFQPAQSTETQQAAGVIRQRHPDLSLLASVRTHYLVAASAC